MRMYDGMPLAVAWRVVERRGVDISDLFGIVTASPLLQAGAASRGGRAARRPGRARPHPGDARQVWLHQPQEGAACLTRPNMQNRLLGVDGLLTLPTLDDYRNAGGYMALRQAVTDMTPAEVIDEIKASGLRGRGGAGVLTAEKLTLVAAPTPTTKYVICNAYDADPRSRIAATLLERNPHQVLEGMALAAYAIGANEGYLYMRAGESAASAAVRKALGEALENGAAGTGHPGVALRVLGDAGWRRARLHGRRRDDDDRDHQGTPDEGAAAPALSRHSLASSTSPPPCRTSRRWRICPGSSGVARRASPLWARRPHRARSSSPSTPLARVTPMGASSRFPSARRCSEALRAAGVEVNECQHAGDCRRRQGGRRAATLPC